MAAELEISATALGNYEQGKHPPSAEVLAIYRSRFGVDLDWLLFGAGAPPPLAGSRYDLDKKVLGRLGEMIGRVNAEAGIRPPKAVEFEVAAELYVEFLTLVPNPAETPARMVDAAIAELDDRFRKRVADAARNPGAGKREAS